MPIVIPNGVVPNLGLSSLSLSVVNRDKPTVIAYLLLRMTINSENELVPKLNNRLDQGSDAVC